MGDNICAPLDRGRLKRPPGSVEKATGVGGKKKENGKEFELKQCILLPKKGVRKEENLPYPPLAFLTRVE